MTDDTWRPMAEPTLTWKQYEMWIPALVELLLSSLHSVRFGQLLRCAHKRIVKIMKLYIETNNMQVEMVGPIDIRARFQYL